MDGYRALLIGNSTFPADPQNLQDLKGPVKDVAVLAAALTDRDTGLFDPDHVGLLVERSVGKILEEIETFLNDARREDKLLLFYSGHGLLDERNGLFLAANNTRIDRLRSTAVNVTDISDMLDSSAARTVVIMLDCCHSGAFKGNISPANLAGSGRFVLTSIVRPAA
ncbi:MAG: caspase family protein [Actinomycetota bacterium]|nr:caspase family protein [Actinomycetota bacterium]